ncbi:hypothetical protein M408DRAFT_295275 [Serendipita vermifera MAFF 305830]|uniref:C2H2-type domain-containing protein n=1 Tax=Serendipita vermifera MAFF 305830 TaxID=933852 RepID=A0A0C3BFJ6_SERVB|nr:hypothetical protein M408DRAFT_295275 [Serendipita vermifera MAFF 305830]
MSVYDRRNNAPNWEAPTCHSNLGLSLDPYEYTDWSFSANDPLPSNDQDGLVTYSQSQEYNTSNSLIPSQTKATHDDAQSFRKHDHGLNVNQNISQLHDPILHDHSNWTTGDGTPMLHQPPYHDHDPKFPTDWISSETDDITAAFSDDYSTAEETAHYTGTPSQSGHYQSLFGETHDFSEAGEEILSPSSTTAELVPNPATNYPDAAALTHTPFNHPVYNTQYHRAESYPTQEGSDVGSHHRSQREAYLVEHRGMHPYLPVQRSSHTHYSNMQNPVHASSNQDQPALHPQRSHTKVRKRPRAHRPLETPPNTLIIQPALTAAPYTPDTITDSATSSLGISVGTHYQAPSSHVYSTHEHSSTYNPHAIPLVHQSTDNTIASGHLPDETYTSSNINDPTSTASSSNQTVDQPSLNQPLPDLQVHHLYRLQQCVPRHLKAYLDKCRPGDKRQLVLKTIAAMLSIDANKIDERNDKQLSELLLTLCEQKLYVVETGGPRKGVTAARCAFGTCTKAFGENNRIRNLMHHLVHEHLQLDPFICGFTGCDTAFPWPDDRPRHERKLHGYFYKP